jgi:hypothetical protein
MLRYLRNLLLDLIEAAIIAAFAFTLVVLWIAGTTPW